MNNAVWKRESRFREHECSGLFRDHEALSESPREKVVIYANGIESSFFPRTSPRMSKALRFCSRGISSAIRQSRLNVQLRDLSLGDPDQCFSAGQSRPRTPLSRVPYPTNLEFLLLESVPFWLSREFPRLFEKILGNNLAV
jgi:hypothetical protein